MELAFAASRPVAQLSGGVKGVSQPWQRVKTHRTQALGEAERLEMPERSAIHNLIRMLELR